MEVPVINLIPPSPGGYINEQHEMSLGSNDDLNLSSRIDDKTITPENMECADDDISEHPSLYPDTEEDAMICTIMESLRLTSRKKKKGALIGKLCSVENVSFDENSSNPNKGTYVVEQMSDQRHSNLEDKFKGGNRPKRSRSPVQSNVTNDYSQPPEKFASMDKCVLQSKNTPFRSRLPTGMVAPRALPFAAKNKSRQSSVVRVDKEAKAGPGLEPLSNGSELGMRVSRRPVLKVQPFKSTEYKSEAIRELNHPKTPRTEVKVFEAGCRTVQLRTIHLGNRKIKLDTVVTPRIKKGGESGNIEHRPVQFYGINLNPINKSSKQFLGTHCQPFSFDDRDQEFIKRKLARMKEYEKGPSKANGVSARHASVLHMKPFIPAKSSKEPTLPLDPKLYTAHRAQKREEFEEKLREEEENRMEIRRKRAEEQQRKIAQEVAQLRKALDFKARPAPTFHPFVAMKSTKLLTEPESPECSHSFKFRSK